jgi:hypothetical protein
MNIQGIQLLRRLNLPGPRLEIIFEDIFEVNLERLYLGATHGATILAFDVSEPINQNPLLEKNVRVYRVKREEFKQNLEMLTEQMLRKGVKKKDLIFLTHQTYTSEDISISGRVAIYTQGEVGSFFVEGNEGLRKGSTDLNPTFVYQCPIVGCSLRTSEGLWLRRDFYLPEQYLKQLMREVRLIPGDPNVDFEVYSDNGKLFYHDLFLGKNNSFTLPQTR